MKIIFLLTAAVIMLLAATASLPDTDSLKENAEPACCIKNQCREKMITSGHDDLQFQVNPFHT